MSPIFRQMSSQRAGATRRNLFKVSFKLKKQEGMSDRPNYSSCHKCFTCTTDFEGTYAVAASDAQIE